jgi:hypothetical protein
MRKTVLMSDLSGQEITDHVQIRIRNGDLDYVVDADRSEEIIEQLLAVASQRPKRGRPKKTT